MSFLKDISLFNIFNELKNKEANIEKTIKIMKHIGTMPLLSFLATVVIIHSEKKIPFENEIISVLITLFCSGILGLLASYKLKRKQKTGIVLGQIALSGFIRVQLAPAFSPENPDHFDHLRALPIKTRKRPSFLFS